MKKLFGALVKLFSLLAVLGALLYAAVLYWDKIMAVVAKLRGMLPGLSTAAVDDSEAEDYADWEMYPHRGPRGGPNFVMGPERPGVRPGGPGRTENRCDIITPIF